MILKSFSNYSLWLLLYCVAQVQKINRTTYILELREESLETSYRISQG
uniref:Uncharacterized protein n=1 Tax=Arundo donax TaxID=35708 RepID=A0A0A9BKE6_ARUDO